MAAKTSADAGGRNNHSPVCPAFFCNEAWQSGMDWHAPKPPQNKHMNISTPLSPQTLSLSGTALHSGRFRRGAVKGKFLAAVKSVTLALALAGLIGCEKKSGGKSDEKKSDEKVAVAAKSGPARTEGKIEKAKLEEFSAFLPAEVNDWKKKTPLGYLSTDTQSTATAVYSKDAGGANFTIVIVFSNNMVGQTKAILANPRQATTWGFDIGTLAGYPALFGKAGTNMAGTPFMVLLSNSRMVQGTYDPKSGLTPEMIRPVFEKVDFNGIAEK